MFYGKGITIALIFLFIGFGKLWSQGNGSYVYHFLNLNPAPNVSALGGHDITNSSSITNVLVNPAILTEQDSGSLAVSHAFYYSDIQHTSFNYLLPFKRHLKVHLGIIRADYGVIDGLNEFGMSIGSVRSNDNAMVIGLGKIFQEKISLGLNLKLIQSKIGFDQSLGLATDVGINYHKKREGIKIGLLFRNIGTQLTTYQKEGPGEKLPFEMILGLSKRLKYVPIRLSVNYRYLNRWNIIATGNLGENNSSLFENETKRSSSILDNFFRHLSFGSEIMIGQKEQFQLRLGYNHKVRKELGLSDYFSFSGFSWGFSVKLKKLSFDFSRSIHHIAGGTNQIGLRANINELLVGRSR